MQPLAAGGYDDAAYEGARGGCPPLRQRRIDERFDALQTLILEALEARRAPAD